MNHDQLHGLIIPIAHDELWHPQPGPPAPPRIRQKDGLRLKGVRTKVLGLMDVFREDSGWAWGLGRGSYL